MIAILTAILLMAAAMPAQAQPTADYTVYLVELNDEVDSRMWTQMRRSCSEAIAADADLMLIHLNTYGGAVDAADSIRTALIRMPIPTVAFVDPNAASAGSLIALACDTVYMAPGASMGASTVVNGSGEPMPDKFQAYMRSVMRATAESHGKVFSEEDSTWVWRRNPAIAEGFVRVDSVISLSAEDAVRVGYAEGIEPTVDDVISRHFAKEYRIVRFEKRASEDILGFLTNAGVRAILIALILAGLYMEMHTPGMGFPSAVSLVCAALFFLPMIVSGTVPAWALILFMIGVVLLALEIFVIPGFGVCGISGIIAVFIALIGSIVAAPLSIATAPWGMIIVPPLLAVALVWYLMSKYGPKWFRRTTELQTTQKVDEGYIGVPTDIFRYVGAEGVAETDLRPSGKIRIDGESYDAVSIEGYIDAGRTVRVVRCENAQLYVKTL